MHNITLIGMPGSGKTTFGKTLAAGLSYHFIDTDDVIIQTYHKPLMELSRRIRHRRIHHTGGKSSPVDLHQSGSDLHRRQCCLQR
mgnify:CR=1 FL=1